MGFVSFTILLFLVIKNTRGNYGIFNSCDDPIHMECSANSINMMTINNKASLAPQLLKKCNGHRRCDVANKRKECVNGLYLCQVDMDKTQKIELAKSPADVRQKVSSQFHLMSKGYLDGLYSEARNITCSLKTEVHRDSSPKMKITIYELAPFLNSSDFCFYVNDVDKALRCSGLKKFAKMDQENIAASSEGWEFAMKLVQSAAYIPEVRFWIGVDVSPKDDSEYHLECSISHSVQEVTTKTPTIKTTTTTKAATEPHRSNSGNFVTGIMGVVGTLLMVAVLVN